MIKMLAWIGVAAFVTGFAVGALAAQPARVEIDGAKLSEGPGKSTRTLEKLHRGQALAVSNYPTQGFYKARTSEGNVGWVPVDSLQLPGVGAKEDAPKKSKGTALETSGEPGADLE